MIADDQDRVPYIGVGEDGARRSGRLDRERASALSWSDKRRIELEHSAERWEAQAARLMRERVGPRPNLTEVRMSAGAEDWLAAIALLDLSSVLADDAALFTGWDERAGRYTYSGTGENQVGTFHPDAYVDWPGWVNDVDTAGRLWSSGEQRLFAVIASLVVRDRPLQLAGVLDKLGSIERQVLEVLVQWAGGGNNREIPGRYRLVDAGNPR